MKASKKDLKALRAVVYEADEGADNLRRASSWTRYLMTEEMERKESQLGKAALVHPNVPQWGSALREMFTHLYDSALDDELEKPDEGAPAWVGAYVGELAKDPTWDQLREQVRRSEIMTGMACDVITKATKELVAKHAPKEDEEKLRKELEALRELAELHEARGRQPSKRLMGDIAETEARLEEATAAEVAAAEAFRKAGEDLRGVVSKRLGTLEQDIEQAREIMESLGFGAGGMGAGTGNGHTMTISTPPDELVKRVKGNKLIAEVAKLAGRLRQSAAMKRETLTNEARGEITQTTLGDDLSRLLPSELMYAGEPDPEWLLLRKLSEKSAQQYEMIGRERAKEGPIVILVDESGSMSGVRIQWAKAVAVTLMGVAAEQRRPFAIMGFCEDVVLSEVFDPASGVDAARMLNAVTHFANGGTCIANALRGGVNVIESNGLFKKADLILVSDGDDGGKRHDVLRLMDQRGIALHSIFIDGRGPKDLIEASDHVVHVNVNEMTSGEADKKVGAIFTVGMPKTIDV